MPVSIFANNNCSFTKVADPAISLTLALVQWDASQSPSGKRTEPVFLGEEYFLPLQL